MSNLHDEEFDEDDLEYEDDLDSDTEFDDPEAFDELEFDALAALAP